MAIDHLALSMATGIPPSGRIRLGIAGRHAVFDVCIARVFLARLKGWMLRRAEVATTGLWLIPCDAIHTFFMRFEIDVLFLDANRQIIVVDHRVKPWRIRACFDATSVIELPAGRASALSLAVGDRLEIRGQS